MTTSTPTQTAPTTPADTRGSSRSSAFRVFFIVLLLIAIGYGVYWFLYLDHYQSTDDAYVACTQVQVTAQTEGTISEVLVLDTQAVKAGDVLFRMDPSDQKVALEKADVDLVKAYYTVKATILNAQQRKQDLDKAQIDYKRRTALQGEASVSKDEIDRVKLTYDNARIAYEQALASAENITDVNQADRHSETLKAINAVRQAYLALVRTDILSPANAVVAKRSAQLGQRVSAGTPAASLVMNQTVWVDANFKENQIRFMRVGQSARVEADVYGSKVVYSGKVAGFAPGTGSTLALLPPQNASGNWVKVVQRLPVRIEIDPEQLKQYPLNIGLSMDVKVDVSNAQGLALAPMEHKGDLKTDIYAKQLKTADEHILTVLKRAR